MSAELVALRAGLSIARKGLSAAFGWIVDHPWQAALIVAAAWIAWAQLVTIPGRDATIADQAEMIAVRTAERDQEKAAHRQTKLDYAAAQLAARVLEEQRLARVAAEQETISDDVTQDYRARLAAARSSAERLRQQLAQGGAGAGRSTAAVDLPGAGGTAGGADAPSGDRRLPFDADELDWRLTATEQAIQLDELINWVERQGGVEVND